MTKPRGQTHTTLTETAELVVRVLGKVPGLKMIAPGEIKTIKKSTSGGRHLTIVKTASGVSLIITGQSVQRVAVHTVDQASTTTLIKALKSSKRLQDFRIKVR